MKQFFTPINFFIVLAILILGSVANLMYGSCQNSKFHYIVQAYYMPNLIRKDLDKERIDFTGKWTRWYKSGAKNDEGYIGGKKNGNYTYWDESGVKTYEIEYKNGILNMRTWWYLSGLKEEVEEYKDGELNKRTWWYNGGAKQAIVEHKDYKVNGKFISWFESGAMKEEGEYKDGILNGKFTIWFDSGKKKAECEYKDGKIIGKGDLWDENGNKIEETQFALPSLVISEIRSGRFTTSRETPINGKINEKLIEEWQVYGIKTFEAEYKDDKLNGKLSEWNKNGKKKRTGLERRRND